MEKSNIITTMISVIFLTTLALQKANAMPDVFIKMERSSDKKTVYLVGDIHCVEQEACKRFKKPMDDFTSLLEKLSKTKKKTSIITEMSQARLEQMNSGTNYPFFIATISKKIKDVIEKEKSKNKDFNMTYCTGDDVRHGSDQLSKLSFNMLNIAESNIKAGFSSDFQLAIIAGQLTTPQFRAFAILNLASQNALIDLDTIKTKSDKDIMKEFHYDYLVRSAKFTKWMNLFAVNNFSLEQQTTALKTIEENKNFIVNFPPNLEAVMNIASSDSSNFVVYYGRYHIEKPKGSTSTVPTIKEMLEKLGFKETARSETQIIDIASIIK
ncbi:MAG: hypothetical protein HQK51_02995 [Oligoflexia bacterium]|nr:hypothetical protein [Oligoflexia bacterium]